MLPPETARVWSLLEKVPTLAGAILIGGTALALRLNHRHSYDLDFCFRSRRLPTRQIEQVLAALAAKGITVFVRAGPRPTIPALNPYPPATRRPWSKCATISLPRATASKSRAPDHVSPWVNHSVGEKIKRNAGAKKCAPKSVSPAGREAGKPRAVIIPLL